MASLDTEDIAVGKKYDLGAISKHLGNIAERLVSVDSMLDGLKSKHVHLEKVICGDDGVCEDLEGCQIRMGETQADMTSSVRMFIP